MPKTKKPSKLKKATKPKTKKATKKTAKTATKPRSVTKSIHPLEKPVQPVVWIMVVAVAALGLILLTNPGF